VSSSQPGRRAFRIAGAHPVAVVVLAMVLGCLVGLGPGASATSPDAAERAARGSHAGRLTVSTGPLLPADRTRAHFIGGSIVNFKARTARVQGKPALQTRTKQGWRTVRGLFDSYAYGTDSGFSLVPERGRHRFRVLWHQGESRQRRLTNTVVVTASAPPEVSTLVKRASVGDMLISGDGNVVIYSVADAGRFVARDRSGATDTVPVPDGYGPLFVSDDGRYFVYRGGGEGGDTSTPYDDTATTYRYDRVTKTTSAISTSLIYPGAGDPAVRVLDVSDDGQHALLEKTTGEQYDGLVVQDLSTGVETEIHTPTETERAAGFDVPAAVLSATGDVAAFDIGKPKKQQVRVWHRDGGPAVRVAPSRGPHVMGSVGGGAALSISDDGSRLLYDNKRALEVIDLTTLAVTKLPLYVEIGQTDVAELAGNGTSVLLDSGAAQGIYRIADRRWLEVEEDGAAKSIANNGRTVPLAGQVYGDPGPIRLWTAPL
jgi:hypothetical protein